MVSFPKPIKNIKLLGSQVFFVFLNIRKHGKKQEIAWANIFEFSLRYFFFAFKIFKNDHFEEIILKEIYARNILALKFPSNFRYSVFGFHMTIKYRKTLKSSKIKQI